jgi:hypothetical protein
VLFVSLLVHYLFSVAVMHEEKLAVLLFDLRMSEVRTPLQYINYYLLCMCYSMMDSNLHYCITIEN